MRFFDRINEIKLLRKIREESRNVLRFTMLKGRRRIGKTTLLSEAYGDEDFLYFFVARKNEVDLCSDFQLEIERFFNLPMPGQMLNFESVFRYLIELSKQRHFTLVIDEFQEFLRVNPSVYSEMQRDLDRGKNGSKLNLVVCGSINRLMDYVFSSDQPLYGRLTHEIDLRPFTTDTIDAIFQTYSSTANADDLLTLWTLSGGVAKYLELLMDGAAFTRKEMISRVISDGSTFINEGKALLLDEFGKDYACYFSVLSSISCGRTSRVEIQSSLGGDDIGGYLTKLRNDYRIIDRLVPFASDEAGRNVHYGISDEFLRFWFRFIYKYQALAELKAFDRLRDIVMRDFDVFIGRALEDYFAQRIMESGRYTAVGGWWDRRGENEIDIVAADDINRKLLFAEVKRSSARINLNILREKADSFRRVASRYSNYEAEFVGLSLADMRRTF